MQENTLTAEQFNALPLKERVKIKAETKLTKHFRGLESAGLLDREQTAEYIGYIKDLIRLADQAPLNP